MNVLVVVCDALHLGYVGCYGNEWVQTPHLDALAADGFVFDRCYSNLPQSGCWRATGLTGIWQPREVNAAQAPTLVEMLRKSGVESYIRTLPSSANPSGSAIRRWFGGSRQPAMASLDEVRQHPEYRVPPPETPGFDEWTARWRRQLAQEADPPRPSIEAAFDEAAEWIQRTSAAQKLVWLEVPLQCLNASDTPWLPPPSFVEQYLDDETPAPVRDPMPGFLGESVLDEDLVAVQVGYAARVSFFDQLLGDLLESIRNEAGDWTIIVTADQGFPLGEHSVIGNVRPWLYEERAHVPLLVRDPGGRSSSRSPSLVQSVDLYPTLGELFGFAVDSEQGRSLLPLLRGELESRRDCVCAGLDDAEYSIRTNHWSLVLPVRWQDDPDRQRELYAKPEDRWDTNNIEELNREIANHLELHLRRYLDALERGTLSRLLPLDETLLLTEAH